MAVKTETGSKKDAAASKDKKVQKKAAVKQLKIKLVRSVIGRPQKQREVVKGLGLRKIIAGAIIDNAACIAVLKKLGFRIEGTFRQEFLVEGEYRDGLRLGLLKEEFCQ